MLLAHGGRRESDRAQLERSVSVESALELALATCKRHGLQVSRRTVSSYATGSGNAVLLTACVLSRGGEVVARGSGKGVGNQSFASATFEALENWFMLLSSRPWDAVSDFLTCGELLEQRALSPDPLIARMRDWDPSGRVGCSTYHASDGTTTLIPVALTDVGYHRSPAPGDTFDYRPFLKYFSTNGVASGVLEEDAFLHGVLEVVERDSLSRLMISIAEGSTPRAATLPSHILPSDVRHVIASFEEAVETGVEFYALPALAAVPVFHARARVGTRLHTGTGASVSANYAAERAASELLQDHAMTVDLGLGDKTDRAMERLRRYPGVHDACTRLPSELPHSEETCAQIRPSLIETGRVPDRYLGVFTGHLRDAGYITLRRVLLGEEVNVVSIYVPGAERYVLIGRGNPMLPSGDPSATAKLKYDSSLVFA